MTEHPDVILYLLFESIRGDWSQGIDKRGKAIIDILPYTNFNDKPALKIRMEHMIYGWEKDKENFDGRFHARDGTYCYYTLFKHFVTLENLNKSNLLVWGKSNDGTSRLEHIGSFGGCHDDVMELYEEWVKDIFKLYNKLESEFPKVSRECGIKIYVLKWLTGRLKGVMNLTHNLKLLGVSTAIAYLVATLYVWVTANLGGYVYFSAGEPNLAIKYLEWILGAISIPVLFHYLFSELKPQT